MAASCRRRRCRRPAAKTRTEFPCSFPPAVISSTSHAAQPTRGRSISRRSIAVRTTCSSRRSLPWPTPPATCCMSRTAHCWRRRSTWRTGGWPGTRFRSSTALPRRATFTAGARRAMRGGWATPAKRPTPTRGGGGGAAGADLVWMGRDGRRLGTVAHGPLVDFRLSPDLRYLAVAEVERRSGRSDLRLFDLVRGNDIRLTTSPATDASPIFSPDGARIVFRSNRERVHDLYVRPAGAGQDAPFLKTPLAKYPTSWSPDGSLIVYHAKDPRTRYDIWATPVDHPQDARPLVQTEFDEMQGQVSPRGRWLAYVSDESSRYEVYVQPLHGGGRRWQISTGGGTDPKWRADERELFYVSPDSQLMSVALGRDDIDPGTPRPLFPLRDAAAIAPFLSAFDVQPDGQRFLVGEPIENVQTVPLTVLVNWSPQRRSTPASR